MDKCSRCSGELSTADIDGLCAVCRYKPFMPLPYFVPVGWECQRCGTIHAPWVAQCTCPPPYRTSTGSTSG